MINNWILKKKWILIKNQIIQYFSDQSITADIFFVIVKKNLSNVVLLFFFYNFDLIKIFECQLTFLCLFFLNKKSVNQYRIFFSLICLNYFRFNLQTVRMTWKYFFKLKMIEINFIGFRKIKGEWLRVWMYEHVFSFHTHTRMLLSSKIKSTH